MSANKVNANELLIKEKKEKKNGKKDNECKKRRLK